MSKRVYVTYLQNDGEQRKKLIKLDEGDFHTMTTQITNKFSLPSDCQYAFKGKVDDHGPFVEIDHMDNDILDDLTEVKFSEKTNIPPNQAWSQSQLSTSPKSSASASASSYYDASLASTSTISVLHESQAGPCSPSLIDVSNKSC